MKQWLISFSAEYYCQGYEWGNFTILVSAETYQDAIKVIKNWDTTGCDVQWEKGTPKHFKNLTI